MGSPRLRPALGWPTGGAEHRNTARAARVAARAWNMRRVGFAGSFGGRDHTPFPLYVALAAMFLPGRPVRLANDRFPQFQSGIKCHAFTMRSQIGVDRATGKIVAFANGASSDDVRVPGVNRTIFLLASGAFGEESHSAATGYCLGADTFLAQHPKAHGFSPAGRRLPERCPPASRVCFTTPGQGRHPAP
jgi:hypothetical protein